MKKILLALLLVFLLLAGSASAYASKGSPDSSVVQLRCTFDSYVDPFYVVSLRLTGMKRFSTNPVYVYHDYVWQEIGGELYPVDPELGSTWECLVSDYTPCDDWCTQIVGRIVLFRRIR